MRSIFLLLPLTAFAGDLLTADDLTQIEAPEAPELEHGTIVNGEAAAVDLYPASGGMLFAGTVNVPGFIGPAQTLEMKQFACSSTLIAPDVVLLAAHCVDPEVLSQGGSVEGLKFAFSRQIDLSEPNEPGDPWPADAVIASEYIIHPDWDLQNLNQFSLDGPKNDIALLFLREPIFDVMPAILATEAEDASIEPGAEVEIVGWGLQTPATIIDQFLPTDPDSFGKKFWGPSRVGEVGDYEFQVGSTPDETRKCKGDSGGPTFMDLGDPIDGLDTMRLIGVTSRSADFTLCAEKGGFDTRVGPYLGWIDEEMRAGCEDGRRAWCDTDGIVDADFWAEESGAAGCGCTTGQGGGGLAALLVGLLLTRRRR